MLPGDDLKMKANIPRNIFLKSVGAGLGIAVIGSWEQVALAADARPLIDSVKAACDRLAPLGWREMLLKVTSGALDISASDLRRELLTPLPHIDRSYPGFGDFAFAGGRGVTVGQPDLSLLYHAFASATVVARPDRRDLGGFPSLAEIDSLENFIYGAEPPTLDVLRGQAKGRRLGVAVFALHYRNTPDSVHGRHAELCFARAGIARVGSIEPFYDGRKRLFVNVDEDRPFDFRVTPQRFAAYLAVRLPGEPNSFGPQDALPGDDRLEFWVPLHKLFSGPECIAGLNLDLSFARTLQNEELAQFHKFLDLQGHNNNWRGEDLDQFPFTIRNEKIASLSSAAEFGEAVLVPRPAPMTSVAQYKGKALTFPVYPNSPGELQMSSLFVMPGFSEPEVPGYQADAGQNDQREAPQYTNLRHRVNPDGSIDNLNTYTDMAAIIHKGGYQAQEYFDLTGDGWIEAQCPQLQSEIADHLPAYCMVGLPDFFPQMTQRDLMLWSENAIPKRVSEALWAIQPLALSQTRIAPNISLPVGFSIKDVTVTAIVSQLGNASGPVQAPNGPVVRSKVGLPDGSPGFFDPGWDTSQGVHYTVMGDMQNPTGRLEKFLAGYSLGSPFIEDAKLCAALGSYWPGVAPDATRTFAPGKKLGGVPYPWPTVVPLTDVEIGSAPLPNGKYMPWDGVHGPRLKEVDGKQMVLYPDIYRTDYIDLIGTMTAALTSKIDGPEYKARVLAMETVYWNLGIRGAKGQSDVSRILRRKAAWAVLSFVTVERNEADLKQAEHEGAARLEGDRIYGFHVYRWNPENPEMRDKDDISRVYVEMLEQVFAYVAGNKILVRKGSGKWRIGEPLPT